MKKKMKKNNSIYFGTKDFAHDHCPPDLAEYIYIYDIITKQGRRSTI